MLRFTTSLALVLFAVVPAVAGAQTYVQGTTPAASHVRFVGPLRCGYGYWGHHSASALGDYNTGLANLVEAQGSYNRATSEANINNEQARAQYLANNAQYQQNYFEARRLNEEYRRATAEPRATPEQISRMNAALRPKRVSAAQVEPVSGAINWPTALATDDLADMRDQVETAFAGRSQAGRLDGYQAKDVQNVTVAMKAELQDRISELPTTDYLAARNFLDSLSYEARLAPAPSGLAQR